MKAPIAQNAVVLVMDDDPMVRRVVERQLVSLGHHPHLAANGEQAVIEYQKLLADGAPPDVVILDLTVPGAMGGLETAKTLLALDARAKLVVASGYSNDPVMANYRESGFVGVIAKPFDLNDLSQVVNTSMSIQ